MINTNEGVDLGFDYEGLGYPVEVAGSFDVMPSWYNNETYAMEPTAPTFAGLPASYEQLFAGAPLLTELPTAPSIALDVFAPDLISNSGGITVDNLLPDYGLSSLFYDPGALNFQGPLLPAELGTLGGLLSTIGKGALAGLAGSAAGMELQNLLGPSSSLQTAPKASLLTGACPPGRKLRRIAYGRDICVRKPRMNPLNPKALKRATSRLAGFHKFAAHAEKEMAAAFRKGGFHPAARARISKGGRCGTCQKNKCSCA